MKQSGLRIGYPDTKSIPVSINDFGEYKETIFRNAPVFTDLSIYFITEWTKMRNILSKKDETIRVSHDLKRIDWFEMISW